MDVWIKQQLYETWIKGWMDRWMNGWMKSRMEGFKDAWMEQFDFGLPFQLIGA